MPQFTGNKIILQFTCCTRWNTWTAAFLCAADCSSLSTACRWRRGSHGHDWKIRGSQPTDPWLSSVNSVWRRWRLTLSWYTRGMFQTKQELLSWDVSVNCRSYITYYGKTWHTVINISSTTHIHVATNATNQRSHNTHKWSDCTENSFLRLWSTAQNDTAYKTTQSEINMWIRTAKGMPLQRNQRL